MASSNTLVRVKDIPDIEVGDWTRNEEILLDEVDEQGQRVVPEAAIPEDGQDYYSMHHEDEAIQATHDPELNAEGEDEDEFWVPMEE